MVHSAAPILARTSPFNHPSGDSTGGKSALKAAPRGIYTGNLLGRLACPPSQSEGRSFATALRVNQSTTAGGEKARRPSRAWIDELQQDLLVQSKVLEQKNLLILQAKDEALQAKNLALETIQARFEAERLSLERIRELGMVNARGIIEWAERRARLLIPKRSSMTRLQLWNDIIYKDTTTRNESTLKNCLIRAGWPPNQLAENMVGLYASLSSDIHRDASPRVSQALGGLVISVNDAGAGINTTAGQVLVCIARFNYVKASLAGREEMIIDASPGLDDTSSLEMFLAEEQKILGRKKA